MNFHDALLRYDYRFPPELIAQKPAKPRDSARLLVHDRKTGKTTFTTFKEIGKFLPKNSVLVLNETKVIPARVHLTRSTGGKVALLFLGVTSHGMVRVLSPKKLRDGEFLKLHGKLGFMVKKCVHKEWLIEATFPLSKLTKMLEKYGTMPLPPYIKHSPLSEAALKREYQAVFARVPGSIAAPTASLHFTDRLLKNLKKRGITIVKVTLHVHLGTFAPLTEEQWKSGKLHTEEYLIGPLVARALKKAKIEKRKVIAVGTTVARTLESAFDRSGRCTQTSGKTNLFVREGYTWNMIDGLVTNFHVPKSSLLMLVSSFCNRKTVRSLYAQAIQKKMRLFSFGDGMLIL